MAAKEFPAVLDVGMSQEHHERLLAAWNGILDAGATSLRVDQLKGLLTLLEPPLGCGKDAGDAALEALIFSLEIQIQSENYNESDIGATSILYHDLGAAFALKLAPESAVRIEGDYVDGLEFHARLRDYFDEERRQQTVALPVPGVVALCCTACGKRDCEGPCHEREVGETSTDLDFGQIATRTAIL